MRRSPNMGIRGRTGSTSFSPLAPNDEFKRREAVGVERQVKAMSTVNNLLIMAVAHLE